MKLAGMSIGALLLAAPLAAQDRPDLEGFWGSDFSPEQAPTDLIAKLPPGTVVIEDTGVAEFPRGEFGGLTLTPEAAANAATWDAQQEMTLDRVCLPPSIIYSLQGPFPFEIDQTDDVIVFRYEYFDKIRLVWMDGREHPGPDYPNTKMGFSTGHWDDGELVVDTTHIAASTITNNGLDHSDRIVMQERYRLSDDGQKLLATQWFADASVIEEPGARFISWTRREGEHIYPYECDPTFALEYQDVVDKPEQ